MLTREERRNMNPEQLRDAARYTRYGTLLGSIVDYITGEAGGPSDNATRLEISAKQVSDFGLQQEGFTPLLAAYLSADRSRADIVNISEFVKDGEAAIHGLQQGVKNNPEIVLTGPDYMNLGIHQDKDTRTRVPRLEVAPQIVAVDIQHGGVTQFAFNFPSSAALGRERMQHGQHVQYQVAYTAEATAPAEFPYIGSSTRTRHTVHAPEGTPVGSFGWIRARYVNTRAEEGPWSEPLMFVVA